MTFLMCSKADVTYNSYQNLVYFDLNDEQTKSWKPQVISYFATQWFPVVSSAITASLLSVYFLAQLPLLSTKQ